MKKNENIKAKQNLSILILVLILVSSCVHTRGNYYRIKKGDTLYGISRRYDVNPERLMVMNEIKDPTDIAIGTVIYLPRATPTLPIYENKKRNKSNKYYRKTKKSVKMPKNMDFSWPVKGTILTRYGRDGKHRYDGINIEAPWGEEIKAAYGGKVVYSGNGVKGYGNMVIVKHVRRIYSIYALNSENLVSKGDDVKKNQVIAKVGGIPRIGKSFLHFQIRAGKRPVNPVDVLK